MANNTVHRYRNDLELNELGLAALRKELGIAGTARFLRLYAPGYGDYTAERGQWLDHLTMEDWLKGIYEQEQLRHEVPYGPAD